MNVGPAFFGASGAGTTWPLDPYTSNLWTAMSVRRVLSSAVNAFTVRRTSDSVIQDIGFDVGGAVDAASLLAFLGANNGTAHAWANQGATSANGFGTATTTRQPACATAGVSNGKLVFDGTDDLISSGASSGTPSAFTVFLRGLLRSTSGTQIILEHSANYNSNNSAVAYYDSAKMSVGVHDTAPGGYARSDFNTDYPNNNVQCWRYDRTQVTGAAMSKLFINGAAETRDANGDSGTLPDSTFSAQAWRLGARNGAASPAALDAHTLLIYEAALSDGDVAAISAIVAGLP